jgi:hypothetical protein
MRIVRNVWLYALVAEIWVILKIMEIKKLQKNPFLLKRLLLLTDVSNALLGELGYKISFD